MIDLYSKILKYLIFPLADLLMKTKTIHYYKKIKKMESWSSSEIDEWQNVELKKLINHAYSNTIYYKKLFDSRGLHPDDIETKEDLNKIPILTREDIVNNFDDLVSKNIQSIPHKVDQTGGTTGTPMKYLLDNRSWSFSNAHNILNWEKCNYKYGNAYIALGYSSIFVSDKKSLKHKIYYRLKNKIELDGMKMTNEIMNNYLDIIKRKKIKFIYGYASSIYLLAKYVLEIEAKIDILGCFPTSEILTKQYRSTIQNAFNCAIVNCYGAHDAGITAFEHDLEKFEVSYNAIVRIEESDAQQEIMGPIIVTNLLNYAMPIINYKLGDTIETNIQEDNYNGQLIKSVFGRTSDIISLENGRILTGFSYYEKIFELPVQAWNLYKTGENSLICKIVKTEKFVPRHEKDLIEGLKKYAGKDCTIKVEYAKSFKTTKSGKRTYFIK